MANVTVKAIATKSAVVDLYHSTFNDHTSASASCLKAYSPNQNIGYRLLVGGFIDSLNDYKYKKLISCIPYVRIKTLPYDDVTSGYYGSGTVSPLKSDFETSVTYDSAPTLKGVNWYSGHINTSSTSFIALNENYGYTDTEKVEHALTIAKYGFSLSWDGTVSTAAAVSNYRPYVDFTFSDENVTAKTSISPSSGYTPKNTALVVSWGATNDGSGSSLEDIAPVSSVLHYYDASGAEKTVDAGSATAAIIPAADITAETLQYWAVITLNDGDVVTTDVVTMSTTEVLPSATIIKPKSTIVDASSDTVFQWKHVIDTGTAQTAADVEIYKDSAWETLTTISGAANYYTVPADTLTTTVTAWRVRTYNTDNACGEYATAYITVVGAPGKPSVSATGTPRPDVTWQADGQQAYEVVVDGTSSGTLYGDDKSYKCGKILADGTHTIQVRVQNSYGLWSEYGEAIISVTNSPGADISLIVSAPDKLTAHLDWSSSGYSKYAVLRDGIIIAVITTASYDDQYGCGDVSYQVYGLYDDSDNYGASNIVQINLVPDCLSILAVGSESWLELAMSSSSIRTTTTAISRDGTFTHFYGASEPFLELSASRDKTISFEVSFMDDDDAYAFECIIGEPVVLKTETGDLFYGAILSASKSRNLFYTSFSCTLRNAYRSEEVSL